MQTSRSRKPIAFISEPFELRCQALVMVMQSANLGKLEHRALVGWLDKASLDIFWLRDDSLADSDNLLAPEIIAQEIVDDLEAALEQFCLIAGDLGTQAAEVA